MPESTPPSLFAEVTRQSGVLRARLIGPSIGQREAPIITDIVLQAMTEAAAAGGWSWLVLDLSSITFMNSMGLGMCIDFRNRAQKAGARTAILGMGQELTALFKMVKVDRLFVMARDEAELAKSIKA
jgi:anti-anti-sigma factor